MSEKTTKSRGREAGTSGSNQLSADSFSSVLASALAKTSSNTSDQLNTTAFTPSRRTKRTPPQGNSTNPISHCILCTEPDEADDMVQCDSCQKWCHFKCAKVDASIKDDDWKCQKCTAETNVRNDDAKSKSTTSRSSKSSAIRRIEIERIRLEEERKLKEQIDQEELALTEKRDKEMLEKKMAREMEFIEKMTKLRFEEEEETSDTNDDDVDVNLGPEKVDKWLNGGDKSDESKRGENIDQKLKKESHTKAKKTDAHKQHKERNRRRLDSDRNTEACPISARQLASRHVLLQTHLHFSGLPEDWPLFISSFERMSESCGFTNDEKLVKLQSALKGDARDSVHSLLMHPANVPNIIDTLQMLYGRPNLIIRSLLKKVRDQPGPKDGKLDSFVKFAMSVQNICASMTAAKLQTHLNNPDLIQELTDKLPMHFKIEWAKVNEAAYPDVTLATFSDWLSKTARSVSSIMADVSETTSSGKRDGRSKSYLNTHSSAESTEVTRYNPSLNRRNYSEIRKCQICDEICTSPRECQTFVDSSLEARWAIVRAKKLCWYCLRSHVGRRCRLRGVCGINNCVRKHNRLLHEDEDDKKQNESTQNSNAEPLTTHVTHQLSHQPKYRSVLFRIVPVVLYGKDSKLNTYAFLDEGSSISLIDEDVADELGLNGVASPLCLKWTSDVNRTEYNSKRVNLQISSSIKQHKRFQIRDAHTVKSLDLPVQSISVEELSTKYPHLKGIALESYENVKPRILIGLDNGKLGLTREYREGRDDEPVATKTQLGWVVHGTKSNNRQRESELSSNHHLHICECDTNLQKLVKSYFSLDSLGAVKPVDTFQSVNEKRSRQILENTTVRVNDRYETGLIWKSDHVQLPSSLSMAKKRMECLERRMERDVELSQNLHRQIREYGEKGYIRELKPEEIIQCSPRTWYLPIFPVINLNKPGKIRLVWDAAAEVNGVSLNSALLKGPDQLNSLTFILFRFRERRIAVCGDIREMYHQVIIRKQDQNSQRFIWREDSTKEFKHFAMQVMTFGATCSPSSAQFVLNKNASQFAQQFPRAVKAITDNHYVDDLLDSLDSEEEAIELAKNVRAIHHHGGFEIRNWVSNSSRVTQELNQTSQPQVKNMNVSSDDLTEKVLGMWWCTSTDTFTFSLSKSPKIQQILKKQRTPTKREVLRTVMSIFDPLGLLSHYVVYVKILLQEIWRTPITWDDAITENQLFKWKRWIALLPKVECVQVPRCYLQINKESQCDSVQLHIMVDASEYAYAAVGYLRFQKADVIETVLVGAKTRVAPLKPMTIPRLELEAAVLGTRLAVSIAEGHSLKITSRHFWSDSKTVLCWLRSDHRKFKMFVACRIGEILEASELEEWRWVPTKLNAADDATKWSKEPDFTMTSRWFMGPQFIRDEKSAWPIDITIQESTSEEAKFSLIHTTLEKLIAYENFSSWQSLLRSLAVVLRYVANLKAKCERHRLRLGPLEQEEYLSAETRLYQIAQSEGYTEEVDILRGNLNLSSEKKMSIKKSSIIYKDCPYIDENGIMRARGRIDAAINVPNDMKRPILLPQKHHITRLVIQKYHEKYHHISHETVLNEILQRFAIPKLRVAVKSVTSHCQYCKIRKAKPEPPLMASLPSARLASFTRPFSFIGLDYFGPILVTVGRRTEKRWGVLITCLTSRAVHLEIAHSLSTDSCIMCLHNFMSRRGTPREIYSDNGTNFKGASRELQMFFQHSDVVNEFTTSSTKWMFIPPASPHMGGSWERLVGSVKRTLEQIAPKRNPTDELLRCMFAEVERILNSRPLTYVPITDESQEALTPNHLLLGSSDGSKPTGQFEDDGVLLRRNYMIAQQYANTFWRRWIREYLPTLTRRSKWCEKVQPLKAGDIVIVVDENNSRNCWPKGRVLEVYQSNDGQVRQALVQTVNGIYKRPAVKLAVLDVQTAEDGISSSDAEIPRGSVSDSTIIERDRNRNNTANHLNTSATAEVEYTTG